MSKLNRREFQELLFEWRNNFINEEIIQPLAYSNAFAGQISDVDIEDLKSQNYPAYLMILPSIRSIDKIDQIYINNNRYANVYEKSEANYNLIRDKIISLYDRNFTSEDLNLIDDELEDYHDGLYKDDQMPSIPDNFPANEEMIDSLKESFENAKPYMTNIKDGPFIINFTASSSIDQAQASAGLFSISKMKPHVSKSFVAWLLKHDFHHSLEKYIFANKRESSEFTKKSIGVRFFRMPGLSGSRYDPDNFVSVTGTLFGMSKEEKENLLLKRFYNPIEEVFRIHSRITNYDVKRFVDRLASFHDLSNIGINEILNGLFIEDSEGNILYDNKRYRERSTSDPLFVTTRQKLIENVIEITDEFERKIRNFLDDFKDRIIITKGFD